MRFPNAKAQRRGIPRNPFLLLMLAALASLYCNLFRFPFIPIWGGFDQVGFFILASSRFWAGEKFYLDFFDLTTPGIELVHVFFFRFFGEWNWIPNVDLIVVGLVLTSLVAFIGCKVIGTGHFLPLLPAFLFLAFGFLPVMVDSHRWFSSAASFAALAVVMEERTLRRLAIAGGLCGIASFFTQTQGVFAVAGLVVFLLWEEHTGKSGWRKSSLKIACVLASFIVIVLATETYFVWKAGLAVFLDCLFRFPAVYAPLDRADDSFHVYLSEIPRGLPLAHLLIAQGRYFLIHALVPLIYLVFLIWYWRKGTKNEEGTRLILVSIMGLSFFAGVAPSPSYFRLCTVSGPALVLLIYFLRKQRTLQRTAIIFLWIAALFSLAHHPIQMQTSPMSVLQLPRGPFAFPNKDFPDYQLLDWLSVHTRPGDVFFSAGETGIFFPLALRPMDRTTGYDNTGFTRPEDVQNAIATLEKYPMRFIEWPPGISDPKFYLAEEDHLGPLKKYVQVNYHLVKRFDSLYGSESKEIWQRNE